MKHALRILLLLALLGSFFFGSLGQTNAAPTYPAVSRINLTRDAYKLAISTTRTATLRPFPGYTSVVSRRVDFGPSKGAFVLFIPQAAGVEPEIRYSSTKLVTLRKLRVFGNMQFRGFNTSLAVQPQSKKVYLAVGTKYVGASARILEVTVDGFRQVNNPTVAPTAAKGQVLVQFLLLYPQEYGLVTMIADNPSTLKVWRYSNATHRFDEDRTYDTSRISTTSNVLRLK